VSWDSHPRLRSLIFVLLIREGFGRCADGAPSQKYARPLAVRFRFLQASPATENNEEVSVVAAIGVEARNRTRHPIK